MKKFFKIIYLLRYYLLSIFIIASLLALLDIFVLLKDEKWYMSVIFIVVSIIVVIVIDGMTAAFIHKMPPHFFNPERFKEHKGEKKFFQLIKIKKWKDKIPEIGELTCDFAKDEIANPNDPSYLLTFLQEMGYAEVIHMVSCPLGFLIVFVVPFELKYQLFIALPVAIINIFYNLLSALIQRYNRPKLYRYYLRVQKLQNKNQEVNHE